jgi:lysophospholipase L1-like esterase
MPSALIIGDSISMGYAPAVAQALAGQIDVRRSEGNAGDSANLLAHLPDYLEAAPPGAWVHLNCGLHDIKRPFGSDRRQVPLADYRKNLAEIVGCLVYRERKVLWATSTPVIHERHHARKDFDRFEEDVAAYNAAAGEIVAAAGIPVDDLHATVAAAGTESCLRADGVHMTPAGNEALARTVADFLREHVTGAS